MQCKLCLQDKRLCNKSHIIPDFMHQELFDEKHRMVKFTTLMPGSDSVAQSGEHESDILCEDCDNRVIGSLENYASKVLYGGQISVKQVNYKLPDGLEFSQVDGLDYKKFKLFLLSLLWRGIKEIEEGKAEKPDLFMLDLLLPDINGDKILEQIRKTPSTKDSTVFILTNYGGEQMENKLTEQLNAQEYLSKIDWQPSRLLPFLVEKMK